MSGGGNGGPPHPLSLSCLTPRGSLTQAPAAAAGGDSAFLAKQLDLLCSRNYEKNVCHELSHGRLSEGACPGGPTQSCMAASSRHSGREGSKAENFWVVRAVDVGWGVDTKESASWELSGGEMTPPLHSLPCSKESQGITGPSYRWDYREPQVNSPEVTQQPMAELRQETRTPSSQRLPSLTGPQSSLRH